MTDVIDSLDYIEPISVVAVDDDELSCIMLERMLKKNGFDITCFTKPAECLKYIDAPDSGTRPEILITDLKMPDIDGLTVLKRVKEIDPSIDVILITGFAEKNIAIEALRQGAFDIIEKPFNHTALVATLKRTVRYREAVRERNRIAEQLSLLSGREAEKWGIKAFIGRSAEIKRILKDISLLQNAVNTSVLITGESGTGKELIARAVHFGSPKSDMPFIPVNCSAVPGELAESLLFGHKKGAFTGAHEDRKGAFDTADGGTLFLDEIGDMPLSIQTKLLRVLEDGIIFPVGDDQEHHVKVRIIAATNTDLQKKVENSSFRSDLYYRLAAYVIEAPPLRDRLDDIPLLADHFASSISQEMGMPCPRISKQVYGLLQSYSFPGNVRELRNIMERALIESSGEEVTLKDIHLLKRSTASAAQISFIPHSINLKDLEIEAVKAAMDQTEGNISAAARLLGISRARLYRKLKET